MASETLDVFAVLANRLGAWSMKAELEDLSFKTLNPEEYEMVAEAVAARVTAAAAATSSSGEAGLAGSIHELTAALEASGFQVVDVSGRVKNIYGVWKKVQKCLRQSTGSSGSDSEDQEQQSPAVSPAAAAAAPASPGSSDSNVRRQQLAAAVAKGL